ncbi:hypothetical protein [Actinacidiphila acidipaludis]|uniref:Uncharacterized protein n=1 Tax=Actinacidiphila acidipaludis TaxID=2873382 RepID=A0ABS7QG22_9ACTN|nr:hypothetical protein [Streptomyces acidipaludis]MBY8881761.1 hypothetical protein [Streptomyces acidipaludis]
MEQPIGQNVTPTTPAAGTDPAFFPGLVPPQAGEPGKPGSTNAAEDAIPAALKGSAARKPAAEAPEPEAQPESQPESAQPEAAESGDDAAAEDTASTPDDALGQDDRADDEDADDGKPVFEASDRRAGIVADRHGVTFTLDEETAEFGWDEIGAVEIDTPRFGKRFGVTVYTSTRRWFQCDVEASSRSELKAWTAELDAVLDARFEDEKPEAEEPQAEADSTAVTAEDADGSEDKTAEKADDKAGDKAEAAAEDKDSADA